VKWKYNFIEVLEEVLDILQPEEQAAPQAPAEEKIRWGRFAVDVIETLVLAALLFLGINAVSARVRVDGFSMRPTLEDGEFVLVNRLAYRFADYQRGDIIVFKHPGAPPQDLIKRIIGLPGDTVVIANGKVTVNGHVLNEPYIADAPDYSGEWVVPEDSLFVLGDNRNNSSDSHSWNFLPMENVIGRAVLIYWPPRFWDVIQHADVQASSP